MRRIGVIVTSTVLLAVAAAGPVSAVTIRGSGTTWRPSSVNIGRGDQVRWRAVSNSHTVRAYGGNWRYSKRINEGGSVSRTFRQRGTYRFYCSIHGDLAGGNCTGMCGKVLV
ncbi:MAG: cupredoxin domain-containing protein [Actinomycetota bacterium]